MAVSLVLSGGGLSTTKTATNVKAIDIITRCCIELGMYDPTTDLEPSNIEKAEFWMDEIQQWAQQLARDNRKRELIAIENEAVDSDTSFDWNEV